MTMMISVLFRFIIVIVLVIFANRQVASQVLSNYDSLTASDTIVLPMKNVDTSGACYYTLNKEYVKSFLPALKYTVSRPAHWNKRDWTRASLLAAGTLAVFAADWEIKNMALHNRSNVVESIAKTVEPFGNTYGVYLFPTMYAVGVLTKQPKLESAGLTGGKALVISTLLYTASKKMIRRNRPDATTSSFDYAIPFTKRGYTSSPSGHSNTIFTAATILALEFKEHKWVAPLVYTIAATTAASRIYHNRHWASDVVLGSITGHFVSKAVWKASQKKKKIFATNF